MTTPPPQPPPLRISLVSAVYWLHRGNDAHQAGRPASDCPFNPDASVTDFFLAHWWAKGWHRARDVGVHLDLPGHPTGPPPEQPAHTKRGAH